MSNTAKWIEVKKNPLKDLTNKLNEKDAATLIELLKSYYKDGFQKCLEIINYKP